MVVANFDSWKVNASGYILFKSILYKALLLTATGNTSVWIVLKVLDTFTVTVVRNKVH